LMGAGPMGLCLLQAIKRVGAKCFVSDLMERRLEKAREMGADLIINASTQDVSKAIMEETGGEGVPVVIDAVGLPQTLEQAVRLACPAGRVIVLGLTVEPSPIPQLEITKKELDVRGSRLSNNKFPTVIEWFNRKEVRPMAIVSHIFPFPDIHKAFEQVENRPQETYKVILRFD
ncbi:MAG: zinc-binding dehydrogenase, partial [Moorellaceae bacterium]